MSARALKHAWDRFIPDSGAKITLIAIAAAMNDDGYGTPPLPYLMRKTSKARRTIQYILEKLAAWGEIRIERRAGRSNRITYLFATRAIDFGGSDAMERASRELEDENAELKRMIDQAITRELRQQRGASTSES